ncbi:MAG TPA: CsbD family protein [Nocardioides sp.]|uniref:CsbD family protein n=1 Tax=Nocardioides sp. TaxID=35761 RepID=UPI002F42F9C9
MRDEAKEQTVGLQDKFKHRATDTKGKAKEATGAATGDESLKAEGKDDQGQAKAKEAGRHVKEAGKNVKESLEP